MPENDHSRTCLESCASSSEKTVLMQEPPVRQSKRLRHKRQASQAQAPGMHSAGPCLPVCLRIATLTDLMPAGVSLAPSTPPEGKRRRTRKPGSSARPCDAPVTPSEEAGEPIGCHTAPTVRARHDSASSAGDAQLPQMLDLTTTPVPAVSAGGSSVSLAELKDVWQLVQAAAAAAAHGASKQSGDGNSPV
jgi:hypothetical protein